MKKITIFLIVLAIIGFIVWLTSASSKVSEEQIVSRFGLHWHPTITMYVKGQKLEIPSNIGLESNHKPIHTHIEDAQAGVIHLEFQGVVKKSDITLSQFFQNWNKEIGSFGSNMKMTVNGIENTEYGNYVMKENDKIELRFE